MEKLLRYLCMEVNFYAINDGLGNLILENMILRKWKRRDQWQQTQDTTEKNMNILLED